MPDVTLICDQSRLKDLRHVIAYKVLLDITAVRVTARLHGGHDAPGNISWGHGAFST